MEQKHQLIYELECSLLMPKIRKSAARLKELIAEEFIEHGSSGLIYNKDEIIQSQLEEEPKNFRIENFSVLELSPEVMLATYRVTLALKSSLRVSVWQRRNNRWQMVFHQGTPCEEKSL